MNPEDQILNQIQPPQSNGTEPPPTESPIIEFKEDPAIDKIEIDGVGYSMDQLRELTKDHTDFSTQKMNYERMSQEVAAEKQSIQKEREIYSAKLGRDIAEAKEALEGFKNVDWVELGKKDLAQYIQAKEMFELARNDLESLEREKEDLIQMVTMESQREFQKAADIAISDLRKTFKTWNNEIYYSLVDYGVTKGYSRESLLRSTDSGLFKMLANQKNFEEMQGKSPDKRINMDMRSRTGTKMNAITKAKLTGSESDAMEAFAQMFG